MTFTYMNIYGVYNTLGAILNNLVSPYGFTAKDSSLFGASFILGGIVASVFTSAIVDKTKKYLLAFRILSFASLVVCLGALITLPLKKVFFANLNVALLGAFLVPVVPLGFSFSVELTHPVSEAMSNGIIALMAQLLGFGMTILSTAMCQTNPLYCVYMFAG